MTQTWHPSLASFICLITKLIFCFLRLLSIVFLITNVTDNTTAKTPTTTEHHIAIILGRWHIDCTWVKMLPSMTSSFLSSFSIRVLCSTIHDTYFRSPHFLHDKGFPPRSIVPLLFLSIPFRCGNEL